MPVPPGPRGSVAARATTVTTGVVTAVTAAATLLVPWSPSCPRPTPPRRSVPT